MGSDWEISLRAGRNAFIAGLIAVSLGALVNVLLVVLIVAMWAAAVPALRGWNRTTDDAAMWAAVSMLISVIILFISAMLGVLVIWFGHAVGTGLLIYGWLGCRHHQSRLRRNWVVRQRLAADNSVQHPERRVADRDHQQPDH